MAKKKRKKLWYQYHLRDVFGKEWKTDPVLKGEQVSMVDIYDGSILGVESEEERYRRDLYRTPSKICVRTTVAGQQVELDIYPVWGRHDVPRGVKSRESSMAQKNLNRKNSQRKMLQYLHANFQKGDLIMTLTYDDYYYPDKERAQKDIHNFFTAIRRERKKADMEPLKYIYVIEYVSDPENTNKVRIHHHLIINSMDRDLAESKWTKGRVNAKYADPDGDFGLEGFGRYITKTAFSKGEHAWQGSRNLKKPIVHESVTKLTRRKMYDLVHSGDGIGRMMEQMYQGRFRHLDSKIYYSDYVGGYYIYGRLRARKGVRIVEPEKKTEVAPVQPEIAAKQAGPDRQDPGRYDGNIVEENRGRDLFPGNKDIVKGFHPDGSREENSQGNGHADRMHTDIYINASWHGDPDAPLEAADGEYAATNEVNKDGSVHSGHVYGAWRNISRERLYLRALWDALSRYTMACDITVHCDNTAIWSKINNGTYLNCTARELSEMQNADLIRKLQVMLKFHSITVELEAENKYTHAGMDLLERKMKQGVITRKEDR